MSDFKFKDGTTVTSLLEGRMIRGTVVGAATTPFPIMGRVWIVKLDPGFGFPNDTYPYSTVTLPESMLREATPVENFDFHNMQSASPQTPEVPEKAQSAGPGSKP